MLDPLIELTLGRLREMVREPGVLFWVFGFPIVLSIGLGIAFRNRPPEASSVAIVIPADQAGAARLAASLSTTGLSASAPGAEEAALALRKSKVDLVVELDSATSTRASYRYDPARAESRHARLVVDAALQRLAGRHDAITASDVAVTEAGSRYIDFLMPGLIALNLMGSSMWGIGYAVVDARARKLMKRFAATPMRRSYYLGSFILARFVLLILEMVTMLAFARLAFDVEARGGLLSVAGVALAGALGFAGLALLVASRPRKVEVASGWMNFVMMPMWLLSGAFFSYQRFPEILHPFIRALPLTALIDALRGVMTDGLTMAGVLPELAVLGLWGGVSFVIALRWFRWQ